MTQTEKSSLIHQYAAGELSWHTLRERGFENYLEVLAALAEHGLKYPIAPMTGPNVAARKRGIAILTERFNPQTRSAPALLTGYHSRAMRAECVAPAKENG